MNKCANCSNEAFFAYMVTASSKINYCKKHIPGFLKSKSYAARLVKLEKVVQAVPAKSPKKKAVVEAPAPTVEEEAPAEESTTEVTEVTEDI
jgi:hypothetical protein